MTKRLVTVFVALILTFISGSAFSGCLVDDGVMRSSTNCLGMPTIDKFFDPTTFIWKDRAYLTVNDGNELELWDITGQQIPTNKQHSNFNIPNMGDSDYDLLNQSMCDDCRFGIGIWKKGTVIWDFGGGATPVWGARKFYQTSRDPRGAYTYSNGGSQYIIAKYLPGDLGGEGTLYKVTSPSVLTPIQKIDVPGVSKIANGIRYYNYLYLGMTDNWVYLFRITPSGLDFMTKMPMRGFMLRGKSVVRSNGYMLTAFTNGAKLWLLNNVVTPELLWSKTGNFKLAALSNRYVYLVDSRNVSYVYDISRPRRPTEPDPDFFDSSNPWNNHSQCDSETGAVFSHTGWYLFMARYAVVQKINFKDCIGID